MTRRIKSAAKFVQQRGIVTAGRLAVLASSLGKPKTAKAISQAMRWMSARRTAEMAKIPHDIDKCPHSFDPRFQDRRDQTVQISEVAETAAA